MFRRTLPSVLSKILFFNVWQRLSGALRPVVQKVEIIEKVVEQAPWGSTKGEKVESYARTSAKVQHQFHRLSRQPPQRRR